MTGIFLQLSRVDREMSFGRLLDFGVIAPRLQQLYTWSAHELAAPGLLDCVRDGALTHSWSFDDRHVWQPPDSFAIRLVHRVLPPARIGPRR
ncbi:hypothetical protein [Streptomyces sp. NPDC093514]|uniref:hypothetical protein n=1 Tax=Streptomyces sp. NPDC093514 TaxID=3366039 RepID=UPI0038227E89